MMNDLRTLKIKIKHLRMYVTYEWKQLVISSCILYEEKYFENKRIGKIIERDKK